MLYLFFRRKDCILDPQCIGDAVGDVLVLFLDELFLLQDFFRPLGNS